MKNRIYSIAFIAFIFLPGIALSQFTISAELRPRFEMDNGTIKPRPDSMNTIYYVSQRTRIKFDLNREKYQLRLSLQDVRIWGNGDIYTSTGVFGSTTSVGIHEAWFSLKLGEYSLLKIGRQAMKLDDLRLISSRNWNQFGLSYDALVYQFQKNKWELSTALSYNNSINVTNGKIIEFGDLFNNTNIIKTLNYIHLKKSVNSNLNASIMAIGAGYQHPANPSVIYMTGTYGLWLKYANEKFDITTNAYFQNGNAQSGKDVNAYMFTLHPGIKFQDKRLGMGWDYFSGDNANNSDYDIKEKTFNKMYGAVIKFSGLMNYYTYMKTSTANGGLIDIYPNLKIPVNSKLSFTMIYHKFYLANPVLVEGAIIDDTDLGSELDMRYSYKILKDANLEGGFSFYFTTETLKKVKNVATSEIRSPYWVWIMITFTPDLFTAK
ncbi:MAG: alginate export family protein [Bacteroidetes bacterium]|nr:alginate export family protein [Bacteroidota bacterium]MBL6944910.1 alginate export family protein [Bacteroidales bacterium]